MTIDELKVILLRYDALDTLIGKTWEKNTRKDQQVRQVYIKEQKELDLIYKAQEFYLHTDDYGSTVIAYRAIHYIPIL